MVDPTSLPSVTKEQINRARPFVERAIRERECDNLLKLF